MSEAERTTGDEALPGETGAAHAQRLQRERNVPFAETDTGARTGPDAGATGEVGPATATEDDSVGATLPTSPELAEAGGEDGAAAESEAPKKGKLPEDFPGHAALAAAGINTYGQARKAGDLTEIPGIGDATAAKIKEALGDTGEE